MQTLDQIDKQFDDLYKVSKDDDLITTTRYSLLNFIHQIYSQAKAEQREEVIKQYQKEGMFINGWKVDITYRKDNLILSNRKIFDDEIVNGSKLEILFFIFKEMVHDIASEIRGQHD